MRVIRDHIKVDLGLGRDARYCVDILVAYGISTSRLLFRGYYSAGQTKAAYYKCIRRRAGYRLDGIFPGCFTAYPTFRYFIEALFQD